MATDQEGGWIRHIKGATTVTPGNMAIGASGRPYDAYRSANIIGKELLALGVNMDFAPSVDLATKPKSYIIGPRAFSDDPEVVAALGSAFARGLEDSGVIPTAKHFPGHGDTEEDSHGTLPVIRIDEKTLWDRELLPYRALAAEGIPAVMSGHLSFPLVSGDDSPASLSPYFMRFLLRDRIGFKGLAVTDDLVMNGAGEAAGSLSEAVVRALRAGNDLLMVSLLLGTDDPAWTRLLALYRQDPEFKARAREAATRVVETKLRYLKPLGKAALVPDLASLGSKVPDPGAAPFFAAMAYRSATLVAAGQIPFGRPGEGDPRLLIAGPFKDFVEAVRECYPRTREFRFSYEPEGRLLLPSSRTSTEPSKARTRSSSASPTRRAWTSRNAPTKTARRWRSSRPKARRPCRERPGPWTPSRSTASPASPCAPASPSSRARPRPKGVCP